MHLVAVARYESGYIDVQRHSYSFNGAQALGDLEMLLERDRRALRIHLSNGDAGILRVGAR
jgi:hypothetical protein